MEQLLKNQQRSYCIEKQLAFDLQCQLFIKTTIIFKNKSEGLSCFQPMHLPLDINRDIRYGFVSFKPNDQSVPKVFLFPISRQGFQIVKSRKELALLLKTKFKQLYPNPEMVCPYDIYQAKSSGGSQMLHLRAQCRICTHTLVYQKQLFGDSDYKLVKMSPYHTHGKDPHRQMEILHRNPNFTRFVMRQNGRPLEIKPMYIDQAAQRSIQHFIKMLPCGMTNQSREQIVCDRFKIDKTQYKRVIKSINAQFDIPLRQLLRRFDRKGYQYRYLPANLLEINQEYIRTRKYNQLQAALHPFSEDKPRNVHDIDKTNPDVPNVFLVITPQMKELYYKYGQYVGFDLTFSLIQERPWLNHKEYMMGVFAGTSQSRRILVYGLVITNTQSEEVYRYLTQEFLRIMGKCPQTIVTDQEKPLYYAIRSLKKDGIFTGHHLFDMFHILKKFRKSCQASTFQVFRKLMHCRDKLQYRRILRQVMKSVSSDSQLNVIRTFDYYSQRYCFSQIQASFVGIGISDSMNQKFHDLIKAAIPYQTKYIKAIGIVMELIQTRNELNKFGIFQKNPLEQRMTFPFMKQYRTVLSDKIFHFLLKEVCKSLSFELLSYQQEQVYDLGNTKMQDCSVFNQMLLNKDRFKVQTGNGIFTVYKVYEQGQAINSQSKCRWKCQCQFQQKSGYLCSHIVKVLMTLGLDFFDNIHPRWIIHQHQIQQGFIKYIHRQNRYHYGQRVRMRRRPRWTPHKNTKETSQQTSDKNDIDYKQAQKNCSEDSYDLTVNSQPAHQLNTNMYSQPFDFDE